MDTSSRNSDIDDNNKYKKTTGYKNGDENKSDISSIGSQPVKERTATQQPPRTGVNGEEEKENDEGFCGSMKSFLKKFCKCFK